MSEYNVEFYTKSNGEKPVKEFLCNRRSPTAAGAALNGSSAVTTAAI